MVKYLARTEKVMSTKLAMVKATHQMLIVLRHYDLASLELGPNL